MEDVEEELLDDVNEVLGLQLVELVVEEYVRHRCHLTQANQLRKNHQNHLGDHNPRNGDVNPVNTHTTRLHP